MNVTQGKRATDWRDGYSKAAGILTTLLAVVGLTLAASGGAVALQADSGTTDFGQSVYTADRGDAVNITVEFDNTNTSTVQIGDPDDDGYHVTAQVEDRDGDGEAVVSFDSETAGSDQQVLSASDGDAVTNVTQGGPFDGMNDPAGSDMLEATDYELRVGAGEKSSDQLARGDSDNLATLRLEESADAEATLDYEGDTLNVKKAANQTISGRTTLDPGTELTLKLSTTVGDTLVEDDTTMTVQDDGSFAYTDDWSYNVLGTEFEVSVLHGDTVLTTADGQVTGASLDYEGDTLNVKKAANQTISGTTTLDPGTELTIRVKSDEATNPFQFRPEATVQDDGSFSVTQDFSSYEPGTEFDVTVQHDGTALTNTAGQITESEQTETEEPSETETEEPSETETESTERASTTGLRLSATSTPTVDGTVRVQITVENIGSEATSVTLNASDVTAPASLSFSSQSSEAGVWRQSTQTWLFTTIEAGQGETATIEVAVDSAASDQTVEVTATSSDHEVSTTTTVSSGGSAVVEAVDTNDNDRIDDREITRAIDAWRTNSELAGTDRTLSNEDIQDLISLWRQGGA